MDRTRRRAGPAPGLGRPLAMPPPSSAVSPGTSPVPALAAPATEAEDVLAAQNITLECDLVVTTATSWTFQSMGPLFQAMVSGNASAERQAARDLLPLHQALAKLYHFHESR